MQSVQTPKPPIPVAIAEGNPLILSAMSEVFNRDPRFSLVTTSATAEGFLGAVMRVPVSVGVIDWAVPMIGGMLSSTVLTLVVIPVLYYALYWRRSKPPERAVASGDDIH